MCVGACLKITHHKDLVRRVWERVKELKFHFFPFFGGGWGGGGGVVYNQSLVLHSWEK